MFWYVFFMLCYSDWVRHNHIWNSAYWRKILSLPLSLIKLITVNYSQLFSWWSHKTNTVWLVDKSLYGEFLHNAQKELLLCFFGKFCMCNYPQVLVEHNFFFLAIVMPLLITIVAVVCGLMVHSDSYLLCHW